MANKIIFAIEKYVCKAPNDNPHNELEAFWTRKLDLTGMIDGPGVRKSADDANSLVVRFLARALVAHPWAPGLVP